MSGCSTVSVRAKVNLPGLRGSALNLGWTKEDDPQSVAGIEVAS